MNDADDIKLTLALILSNQALILAALGQASNLKQFNLAGDVALDHARKIEQEIRRKHDIERRVQ